MNKSPSSPVHQRYNRDDDLRTPSEEGRAPRPASEPEGAEASTHTDKTATDAVTGAPNRPADKGARPDGGPTRSKGSV